MTTTERFLTALARKSFLRLWSYPNVYRDQGIARCGEGKELADLMVVFGENVLLFSDKSCAYPTHANPLIAWQRWCRRAILDSAQQLHGAERWLRQHPTRVFLDSRCTSRLPVALPSPSRMTVYRIVVAHDPSGRRRSQIGGSGSLPILAELAGARAHLESVDHAGSPLCCIGDLDPERGFVHVLDDSSLSLVFREVDTISDFVEYIRAKEEFVRSGRLVAAAGEEDLLAYYLQNMTDGGTHGFVVPPKVTGIVIDEGHWEHLQARPEYVAKRQADRISALWDQVIDEVSSYALSGDLYVPGGDNTPSLLSTEKALRVLASENRVRRRMLARELASKVMEQGTDKAPSFRVLLPSRPEEPAYVFLALMRTHETPPSSEQENEYRMMRRGLLEAYCLVLLRAYPHVNAVVGIGTEAGTESGRSHDLLLGERANFGRSEQDRAEEIQRKTGWLTKVRMRGGTEHEYPELSADGNMYRPYTPFSEAKVGRNERCPCGSGKKFKRCHGGST